MTKQVFGVQEWAETSCDVSKGCPHDCHYCYAKNERVQEMEAETASRSESEGGLTVRSGNPFIIKKATWTHAPGQFPQVSFEGDILGPLDVIFPETVSAAVYFTRNKPTVTGFVDQFEHVIGSCMDKARLRRQGSGNCRIQAILRFGFLFPSDVLRKTLLYKYLTQSETKGVRTQIEGIDFKRWFYIIANDPRRPKRFSSFAESMKTVPQVATDWGATVKIPRELIETDDGVSFYYKKGKP